jgi:signal transduction histidine kinase
MAFNAVNVLISHPEKESHKLLHTLRWKGAVYIAFVVSVLFVGYIAFEPDFCWERLKVLTICFVVSVPIWSLPMRMFAMRALQPLLRVMDRPDNSELSQQEAEAVVKSAVTTPWALSLAAAVIWMILAPLSLWLSEQVTPGPLRQLNELVLMALIWVPTFFFNVNRIEGVLRPVVYKYVPENVARTIRLPFMYTVRKRIVLAVIFLGPYLVFIQTLLVHYRMTQAVTLQEMHRNVIFAQLFFIFLSTISAALLAFYFLNAVDKPLKQILTTLEDPDADLKTGSVDEFGIVAGMLSQRRKLEQSKQEFVGIVTHELRSPLMSLQGFLRLLAGGGYGEVPEVVVKKAQLGERNAQRLVKLINDLLDVEKLQSGKFECVFQETSAVAIVERAIQSVKELAEQNKVELLVDCADTKIYADEDRMVQVMVNLIANAIKHGRGKPVTVSATEIDGGIEFGVKDQGGGVPADLRDAIFERFKQITTDTKARNGTGLGLPIAKALVAEHKGTIGVDSDDRGSYFWARLPLRE